MMRSMSLADREDYSSPNEPSSELSAVGRVAGCGRFISETALISSLPPSGDALLDRRPAELLPPRRPIRDIWARSVLTRFAALATGKCRGPLVGRKLVSRSFLMGGFSALACDFTLSFAIH